MLTHIKNSKIEVEEIKPGLRRQIMAFDSDLMMVKVFFDSGVVAERHKHPHQQIAFIAEGKFEVEIDGNIELMEAGDCFMIPSNKMHGAKCIEKGILIDTFSPMREDFLDTQVNSNY